MSTYAVVDDNCRDDAAAIAGVVRSTHDTAQAARMAAERHNLRVRANPSNPQHPLCSARAVWLLSAHKAGDLVGPRDFALVTGNVYGSEAADAS